MAAALFAATAVCCTQPAAAQPQDTLRSYRLIPSRSTLEESGSAVGMHQFFTHGTFDLVTDYETAPGGSPPEAVPQAALVNVAASLFGTTQWIDHKLRLSSLTGTFSLSDPSSLTFQGKDGQDQPFTLTAVQRGRLLHLTGENNPACCGHLKYKFSALAYEAPYADFNLDGSVDSDDASLLVANMGAPASIFSFELGDADGNGLVDGNDYLTWQREIGDSIAMSEFANVSSTGRSAAVAAVPEPGTFLLVILCSLPMFFTRRDRSHRVRLQPQYAHSCVRI
jgi:hypothetical protein